MITERQGRILLALKETPGITVKELSRMLYVSEPTVRRDFNALSAHGLITKMYGGATVNPAAADAEIPFWCGKAKKAPPKRSSAKKRHPSSRTGWW